MNRVFSLFVYRLILRSLPDPPAPPGPPPPVLMAIIMGTKKYTEINPPILAIFACPHNLDGVARDIPNVRAAMVANDLADCSAQAEALQKGGAVRKSHPFTKC